VLATLAVVAVGCGQDDDRPACNVGNCFDDDGGADGDADADGDGDADGFDCSDPDQDGHVDHRCGDDADDCREGDPEVHPGATEVCNGIDDDCVEGVDQGMLAGGADVVLAPTWAAIVHIALVARGNGFGLLRLESEEVSGLVGPYHLILRELDAAGQPSGGDVEIGQTPNYNYLDRIALAVTEDGYLVAYGDAGTRTIGPWAGVLSLVAVEDGAPGTELSLGEEPGDITPAIAVGATTAFVVWDWFQDSIRHALLSLSDMSIITDGELLATTGQTSLRPTAIWADGRYYVAATAGDGLNVLVIDETGTVLSQDNLGAFWAPSLAWNGAEGAVVFGDTLGHLTFQPLGSGAVPSGLGVEIAPGKLPQIAALPGVFAEASVSLGELNTYRGLTQFSLLDPLGTASNAMNPDDAEDTGNIDATVVPAANGWAIAWIGGRDKDVRLDFVGCP